MMKKFSKYNDKKIKKDKFCWYFFGLKLLFKVAAIKS